ncbi:valine--tRNA ligase [Planctomycetales bacterium ZRK34]|nr:valine--tRNA ligase [Planctomycetales bacterium ZRK34]
MSLTLSKTYEPHAVEREVAEAWSKARAFHAEVDPAKDPYVIVIPPPNVTAALHMGHALNNTIQDILIRWRRMAGDNAVWIPGTDHAGIATQTVVEKRVMQEEGKRRTDFARDEFVAKIQAWKDEYEARITNQLKMMGCSCDFDRQRFTMDDICARAVREAFFELFKAGLIYRGKRLVNWDPVTQTALADDEVEMRDVDGHFWYMNYPLVEAGGINSPRPEYVTVATTRPETMLGDTAVAVNPNDPERAKYIGKMVRLPIVNREIPIVGDDYVVIPDPDSDDAKAKYASGFLKVTPAHDPNDYEIGQRHNLPIINVMAPDGSISKDHGWTDFESTGVHEFCHELLTLDRYEAREAIVDWFRKEGLLAEVRPYSHSVGHSYRSHVPVEPYLSDQWYVKVTDERLAGAALRAMVIDQRSESDGAVWKDGDSFVDSRDRKVADADRGLPPAANKQDAEAGLRFYPSRYAKTFQHWHENIRDWCISRQLWWGHRIPVWRYDGKFLYKGDGWEEHRRENLVKLIADWVDEGVVAVSPSIDAIRDLVFHDSNGANISIAINEDQDDATSMGLGAKAYLESIGFEQDPDVLDTWFSSALWPISTLGWPELTEELKGWNPSSTLCTAREIITLWVSRMVMFNLFFRGQLPFRDVFIHAMIQDGEGQKMSKSLGNGVDPLDIIHSHGSDAMRFTLAAMTTQTQDVKMPVQPVCPFCEQEFEPKTKRTAAGHVVAAPTQDCPHCSKTMSTSFGAASGEAMPTDDVPLARNTSAKFDYGRNFSNKLWNAGRFAMGILEGESGSDASSDASPPAGGSAFGFGGVADRWILARLGATVKGVDKALGEYQFAQYAQQVYDFFWRDYCDWYLEAIKPVAREDSDAGRSARATAAACLDAVLRLLHPVMPYITEKMWEQLNSVAPTRGVAGVTLGQSAMCINAAWPVVDDEAIDGGVEAAFDRVQEVVVAIRNVRNQYNVPPKQTVTVSIKADGEAAASLNEAVSLLATLAGCEVTAIGADVTASDDAATSVLGAIEVYIAGLIDPKAEHERLSKRRDELAKAINALNGRLNNKGYVDKAPAHLVQQTRDELEAKAAELATVEAKLASLK